MKEIRTIQIVPQNWRARERERERERETARNAGKLFPPVPPPTALPLPDRFLGHALVLAYVSTFMRCGIPSSANFLCLYSARSAKHQFLRPNELVRRFL